LVVVRDDARRRPAEGLDVVERLAEHQQNLGPGPSPCQERLLALPLPALCRIADEAHFAALRDTWLKELAEEVGGGDGPLEIVDLERDARPLSAVLDELEAHGIRKLFLHGVLEQPGFARAVAYRWSAGLAILRDDALGRHSLLAPLMDGTEMPTTPRLHSLGADADPRDLPGDAIPYALDRERSMGAWSGILPPQARFGTARAAALREQWSACWSERGAGDAVRCAVLGLDPLLEERLTIGVEVSACSEGARLYVVTGLDGSGKTTHALKLCERFRELGQRAAPMKIFRQGAFLELANELGGRTRRGAPLCNFRVSRVVKLVDSLRTLRDYLLPQREQLDVLVMDRYVETHVAAARSQLGWNLEGHPILWAFPAAEETYWLRLPVERALARLRDRDDALSADEHSVGLQGYAECFEAMARSAADPVLDSTAPESENAERIAKRATACPQAAARSEPIEVSDVAAFPPGPLVAEPRSACLLRLGAPGSALGGDVLELRGFLRSQVGALADAVPESFWLEAYAAQLVLDLRTHAPRKASVALWPGALVRMRDFRDLTSLGDLTLLLASEARIEGVWSSGATERARDVFRSLGASEAGSARLAHDYAEQLEALAREEGWPRL
jgi:thymidylate kinase